MKGKDEEGQMLPFREVKWNELFPEGERPIPYLLEKDVPVYFRIDPVYHLVYRCQQHSLPSLGEAEKRRAEDPGRANANEKPNLPDITPISVESFLDCDFAFLRLDRNSLEQIDISRSCQTPRFTRGGLVPKQVYQLIGNDSRGRAIKAADEPKGVRELVGVQFDEAVVVDKKKWNEVSRSDERPVRIDPLNYVLQGEVKNADLFLHVVDIAKLKQERLATISDIAYPFRHAARMPGLYLMFQAAYALNELADVRGGKKGVRKWLMDNASEKTFRHGSVRTAEKFVWPVVDRNQGGDKRDEFDLEEINELHGNGAISKYKLSYISDGLAMILAIADFWFDVIDEEGPNAPITDLAKKLMVNRFSGLEVGDLVYLISGKRIDLAIESSLKQWVEEQDQLARKDGKNEMGWRDVIDKEERERLKRRQKKKDKNGVN